MLDQPPKPSREPLTQVVARLATPERLWRYPPILLVVTVGLYAVTLARSSGPVEPGGRNVGRDYFAFYTGGEFVNQGRIDELYDPAAHHRFQAEFMRDINPLWEGTYPYRNPPHYAWAMSWLTRLGYLPSLAVWSAVSLLCFAGAGLIWRRWLPPGQAALAVMLAACMPSWFQALAGGQNTFITLLILTGFCALLLTGRDGWAGLALSALSYKFYLIAVPAGVLLAKRRWRALGGLAIGGVLTLALTAAVFATGIIVDYAHFALGQTRLMEEDGFDVHKQHCWYGFFQLIGQGWIPQESIGVLALTTSLASLVLLVPVWRGAWDRQAPDFSMKLAALVVATMLTSPHLLHYDLSIAALPAVLWLRTEWLSQDRQGAGRVKAILLLGFCWLALAEPVARYLHVQFTPLLMFWWLAALAKRPGELQTPALDAKCQGSVRAALRTG